MKIRIGISSKDGVILEDIDKAKSCNLCTHFRGYGLHAFSGRCLTKGIDKYPSWEYREKAKECDSFDCIPEFLVD